jgi:hypothetical protein
VFLAIAVDNLANAQELTAAEEEQEEEEAVSYLSFWGLGAGEWGGDVDHDFKVNVHNLV